MDLNTIILLLTAAVNISLVGVVAYPHRRNLKKPEIAFFILSILFFVGWFFSNWLADTSNSNFSALWWSRATVPTSILGLWFFLRFSFVFPKEKFYSTKSALADFILAAGISIAALSPYVFADATLTMGKGVTEIVTGPAYIWMILIYLWLLGKIFFNLGQSYKTSVGVEKSQTKYLIFGWIIFSAGGVLVSLILPYLISNADSSKFGPLFSIPMVFFMAYSIVRHQFLEIKVIIQRGLIYSLLLGIIISAYLGILFLLNHSIAEYSPLSSLFSGAVVSIVGIFTVPQLENYFRKVTDRWFYQNAYDYAEALHELSSVLKDNIQFVPLKKQTEATLKKFLKSEFVDFQMGNQRFNPLHKNAAIQQEIKFHNKLMGRLILGPKLSGEFYHKDDLKLIRTFANQAAVALEKVLLFEEVKKHSEELEDRVTERTQELENLREDQKQMMIDISHSLQTPLTIMKAKLEDMQAASEGDQDLGALEKTVDEISKRSYDLLRLARLESQEETFIIERVNLSELLEELAEYVSVLCEGQDITLKTSIEPEVFVNGDKRKIEELVNNLISNAIKYIANNRVINLNLKKGTLAEIQVKDTGVGIPKEFLPLIFERYFRGSNVTPARGGMGVGLAISKKIVEKHGGNISVESKEGKGSLFKVNLPLTN